MRLSSITDEHAIQAANIANIGNNPSITRYGKGDLGSIVITDGTKDRKIRIYFNGSNTRLTDKGFEVIEYCYDIYEFLSRLGYTWK
jgi:hypothetical protein